MKVLKSCILIKKIETNKNYIIIVYCNGSSMKNRNLFKTISNYVQDTEDLPANISVFPMSFQEDDIIAPIFHRSDITITRSGGQTGIEIMSVATGKNFIHSEMEYNPNNPPKESDLLNGIAKWEGGNALLIQQKIGSKFIIPEFVEKYCHDLLV